MKQSIKAKHNIHSLSEAVFKGDRVALGQAITLIESDLDEDQRLAEQLLEKIFPKSGNSLRIGITGVPGVGKSTLIESLGKYLLKLGKKIAVLTVDPSSTITKGSILGDKTRMDELSKHTSAFIRPTPSSSTLGGVASKTREAILVCEAAGYDIVIIETVGVGQSEIAVKEMVDFFLLLMLAGAGDELQGIKKGIMEIADAVVITKSDGNNLKNAVEAQGIYQQALHLFSAPESGWIPSVLISSAITGGGIEELWDMITKHHAHVKSTGFFAANRRKQNISWFQTSFMELLKDDLGKSEKLKDIRKQLEVAASDLTISAHKAARKLLDAYHDVLKQK